MTTPNPAPSVAIIGAGITGLTAAFRLQKQGIPFTIYEASPRAGGVIESVERDGYLAEFGPNTILETSPVISQLIQDAGLNDRKLYSNPAADKRFIVRYSRPINLPTSPVAFFTTPLFSLGAKLRLAAEPFIPRGNPNIEESLAQFVTRRIGREFLDYAINPFVAGVYAGDPARLSVTQAFPKLQALEQKYGSLIKGQILGARERKKRAEVSKQNAPKVSFEHGLQELIDRLQLLAGSSLKTHHSIQSLQRNSTGWEITLNHQNSTVTHSHQAVLLCIPAHQLAKLKINTPNPPNLTPLSEIKYPPVTSVVLGFRREDVQHPLDGFGMLIPEVERFRILGTIFSSSLFPNRAPKNHVTLTSYVGGTRSPELASKPQDELAQIVTEDLKKILGVQGKPTFQHQVHYPKAIPQYEVGYNRFKDLMTQTEEKAPGIFLAGHYREGISLGDSIISGDRVTERIAAYIQSPQVSQS